MLMNMLGCEHMHLCMIVCLMVLPFYHVDKDEYHGCVSFLYIKELTVEVVVLASKWISFYISTSYLHYLIDSIFI